MAGYERLARRSEDGYELSRNAKEGLANVGASFGAHPTSELIYDPGERQRIPDQGCWVLITRALPSIEGGLDEHVRVGRVFYAHRNSQTDADGFSIDGTYKVRLNTPWGTVYLWPHEYSAIERSALSDMWQKGELRFHPTNLSSAEFSEQVFYIRSRGIPLWAAAAMALGDVDGDVGWFEPRADLAPQLEELSADSHRYGVLTKVNHERRRAAAARAERGGD